MVQSKRRLILSGFTLAGALVVGGPAVKATDVRSVFVIAMENHNWTQPANQFTGGIQQVYQNPSAPYINSLVDGSSGISETTRRPSQIPSAARLRRRLSVPAASDQPSANAA